VFPDVTAALNLFLYTTFIHCCKIDSTAHEALNRSIKYVYFYVREVFRMKPVRANDISATLLGCTHFVCI
jgi:hypothetical protein